MATEVMARLYKLFLLDVLGLEDGDYLIDLARRVFEAVNPKQ
jgi:hypothetical protein